MEITIFTPTFNRANTIDNLFKSLMNQSSYNFEWLVIDDGSTDNTEDYFKNLKNTPFNITYLKMKNGGKHRAINKAVEIAKGDFFFIVDSDDWLTKDSIELVMNWIKSIDQNSSNIIGVSGLKGYSYNKIVGKTFKGTYVDCTALNRHQYNIYGDKSEVFKTAILKKYKFPEIPGENFISESTVWNRMAVDGYKIRYFNKLNYICSYLDDGLTKNISDVYSNNFKGYSLYVKEYIKYQNDILPKLKMIMAFSYRGRIRGERYTDLARNIEVNKVLFLILSFPAELIGRLFKK